MEQLESTTMELQDTSERLRRTEAERITATRQAEGLRLQLLNLDAKHKGLEAGLRERWALVW